MSIGKNTPYYLVTIAIFLLLKVGYTVADNSDISFLLKPIDKIVGVVTNSNSQHLSESGYYHEKLNIIIDKSCSGFNFWALCFMMLTFLVLKFFTKTRSKILVIPSVLAVTFFLTIGVNTSRILFSIFLQNVSTKFTGKTFSWLHQAEGVFVYLSFLILIYLVTEYVFKKLTQHYAKLT